MLVAVKPQINLWSGPPSAISWKCLKQKYVKRKEHYDISHQFSFRLKPIRQLSTKDLPFFKNWRLHRIPTNWSKVILEKFLSLSRRNDNFDGIFKGIEMWFEQKAVPQLKGIQNDQNWTGHFLFLKFGRGWGGGGLATQLFPLSRACIVHRSYLPIVQHLAVFDFWSYINHSWPQPPQRVLFLAPKELF